MDSTTIQQNRLYEDLADLIPLICPPEGYAEEVAHWRTVLREKLGEGHHAILELGVGGGHNLSHLVADFTATGIDLSQAMLDQCRRLNPGIELHRGDIRRPLTHAPFHLAENDPPRQVTVPAVRLGLDLPWREQMVEVRLSSFARHIMWYPRPDHPKN